MNELVTPRSVIRDRVIAGDADSAINTSLLRPTNVAAINPDLLRPQEEPTQDVVAALRTDQIGGIQKPKYETFILDVNQDKLNKQSVSPSNNSNSNSSGQSFILDVDIDALRKKISKI